MGQDQTSAPAVVRRLRGALRRATGRGPAAAALVAVLASACSGGGGGAASQAATAPFTSAGAPPRAAVPPGIVALTKDTAVYAAAADGDQLVWEAGPIQGAEEDENDNGEGGRRVTGSAVLRRDLAGGRTSVLARNVDTLHGMALAGGWVAYSVDHGDRSLLMAVGSDGRRIVLSPNLAAPPVARGDLIAWGEARGSRQRVVVRNMADGSEWVAADLPSCVRGRCYRLDAVTLADEGVVFDRGAVGPQPSFVVRRRFSDARPSRVALADDPQPHLVPSSAGAAYTWAGHGLYRWDFGAPPRPVRAPGAADTAVALEGDRWLYLRGSRCRPSLAARLPGGRVVTLVAAAQLGAVASRHADVCYELQDLSWAGAMPLSAWALVREGWSEEHGSDEGLVGVAIAGKAL